MRSKAQSFSADAMLALGIFLIIIVVFIYIMSFVAESRTTQELTDESESIANVLSSELEKSCTFVVNNEVDSGKLAECYTQTYENLRNEFNLDYDFCIFFTDSKGDIMNLNVNQNNDTAIYGIGNKEKVTFYLTINGIPVEVHCGNNENLLALGV